MIIINIINNNITKIKPSVSNSLTIKRYPYDCKICLVLRCGKNAKKYEIRH